ncbi:MAG: succinylglutamate desuccinylase/aspartoacylase family protein [Crocinitomicaceae bacterium]|nr:MAG: succinylglutamate desuccinylase/aspartoacylase family protein [Crocinitomicaceae bacterium]
MVSKKKLIILGHEILPGKGAELNLDVAKLHTSTPIQVPVIVNRAKEDGPVLLLMAGMHGDEINGMEIIRRVIRKGWNKPNAGTIICIPVFNIFGFLNVSRELPDGRDLNRSFPGSNSGSLASQFAYHFMKEIAPVVDYVIDFHTGASQRNNFAQIRCVFSDEQSLQLAHVFNPPFIIHSSYISKSIRESMNKRGKKILLFEGGKTNSIEEKVVNEGLDGIKRMLEHLQMRNFKFDNSLNREPIFIKNSKWIRASHAGMFCLMVENGTKVLPGTILGIITDPFGKIERKVKSNVEGFVYCVNETPVVNKGDALFHIGVAIENPIVPEYKELYI